MNILQTLQQLRDDLKAWVTLNLNALNAKIDENTIPIDSDLDPTSTNPVQNQAIAVKIDEINERVGDTLVATQISSAIAKQPHFSGDYNDLTNAPDISEDGSGELILTDENGNVIFKADADGMHTTAMTLDGETAATEAYVDSAIAETVAYVDESIANIPEVDFTGYATEGYVDDAISEIEFPVTDLSNYYTMPQVDAAVDALRDELSESIVSESSDWKVVDGDGNIVFQVDANGAHTTALSLNGQDVTTIIDDKVAALVDSAPSTLDTLNELAEALGDDPNFATTVATELGKKVEKVDGKDLSTNDFTDEYKNTLDNLGSMAFNETDPTVPEWAKAETKPEYTAEEVGLGNVDNTADMDKPVSVPTQAALDDMRAELSESIVSESNEWKVVDEDGNVVFSVGEDGAHTTNLTIGGMPAATEEYVDSAIAEIPTPDVSGQINEHNGSSDAHADIRDLIDAITVPTKVSELSNDAEYTAKQYVDNQISEKITAALGDIEAALAEL